ncbi:endopeptidase La [Candidatus Woesebacteria bacterium RIFOXYA1_FULL_40_18]|uniref:Lon protease n=5 Tax=Candidatus Woeseibacteriota TaxID=1752722 RepID=A0A0G0VJS5_9BACT|nr:MAG: Lon protease [Candidatus Woesebacteria bacterium GW2011_GWB1_40_101]KKR62997.1 MAG: Lon protease [Candidatus Woesebacteria bacterium GW2011_GWA1_40_45]OGM75793.1 MAG: endopeptidase La [Candidatus Woesebacteria bacterium RIFOXYA1_FULL_40_18]OGM80101.1 MAG: endopeptidase La [Candidatus Woesebacteria bacterium RIFOXYB1_FULL_40_26]OGM87818.1 MAG: endopeptidase La [Candidatus Woesebacteria bacterium RIFOXYD1_FULL_40_21]
MKPDSQMTRKVPIVAVRGSVVFPHTDTLLSFGRPKSVSAINSAFQEDRVIAIFTQKDAKIPDPDKEDLYKVGTIATITQMMSTEGEIHALVRGQARISLENIVSHEPYLLGEVVELTEEIENTPSVKAMAKELSELFKKAINAGKQAEIMTVMKLISGQVEPVELADQIATLLEIKVIEKQKLLEMFSLKKRLEKVLGYLGQEVNILELEKSISVKTQKRFEDQMRKAMLREKRRTIDEELGEEGEGELGLDEMEEYRGKIKKAQMPKDVEERAKKELKRLSALSPHNPEGAYIRNYLDWLVEMPWNVSSSSNISIKKAAKILSEKHYGMEKAKERILEFLAVMKIKNKSGKSQESQPTILCFIGPPGVGKTSIGKSIAESLGRKFARVSLGGIRDEAEIRGHRRTYVGALPGRIIQGIKNAGTKNPVFMLDEIDKLGIDFRGDPSSALLEALDPEQNKEFSDHYLEVPFDLSDVMFIATGNMLDTIPPALRDRMEVIRFPGYTEEEKFHIAKNFLWPKQLKLHGTEDAQIILGEASFREIIKRYTRESGVRELERILASICRKIARLLAERKKYAKKIDVPQIHKFLGPQKFSSLIAEKSDEVGMSTGLAVTPAGGEILFIEVALMPGRGKLTLTGQLGEIMRESAKAAFTWAKSHYRDLGLKESFGMGIDVHIHVPEGAVPKDGPSAGVAIATALVSALTGIAVRRNVGMTGEVTLRGRVLEIGGVKEKVIAAHSAGLKTIVLPKDNKKDMEDIPENVKKDIKFVFASQIEEVLEVAMKSWPPKNLVKVKKVYPPSFLAAN